MRYQIIVTPDPTVSRTSAELAEAFDDLPSAVEGLLEEGESAEELKGQRTGERTVLSVVSNRTTSQLKSTIREAFRYYQLFGDVVELK